MRRMLALALAFGLAAAGFARADETDRSARRTIAVVGEAEVRAAPDSALVHLGVTTESDTAAGALSANNAAMAKVIDRAKAGGVEARDIQTSGLSLSPRQVIPERRNERPRIVGYVASNQVTLRLRDLARLGRVLDDLVTAGANDVRGISFEVTDRSRLLDEARGQAVADARRKAELYAQAAGARLGPLHSLSEEDHAPPRPMMRAAPMEAAATVPVETGEMTLGLRVRAVWTLQD